MSVLGAAVQQPFEVLDYDIDYTDFFDGENDVISAVTEIVTGPDATLDAQANVANGNTVKVWIQGGTDGAEYLVTIRATTAAGRIKEDEIRVRIREKD
jgi:hypothetical protein